MATPAVKVESDVELRRKLSVVAPSEDVDWLNFLIYGEPGAGKTHLLGTADDDERTRPVLVFDVEGGTATIRKRQNVDIKRVRTMKELEQAYNDLYHSIKRDENGKEYLYYKTVAIDSLSELTDVDMRYIMKEAYGRNPDKVDVDVPSQREWGKARAHMRTIVRVFRDLPANVIFTSQVATLQDEGQPVKYFPGFAGKLRTELPGFCDVVGYLYPENEQGEIQRYLQVQGTRRVVAKDRTSALGNVMKNATIPEMFSLIHGESSLVSGE